MFNPQKYTALLLDADETIFDFLAAENQAFRLLCESFGRDCSDELSARYHVVNLQYWKRHERGEITKTQIQTGRFETTFREAGWEIDPVEANRRYVALLSSCAKLLPGALDAVKALYGRYRIVIITNGVLKTQLSRFDASEVKPYIAHMYVSDQVGFQKPDKRFFDAVLAEENLAADECLVVGDSPTSDILGAANAGIDSVWVDASRGGASTTALVTIGTITELPALLGIK